MEEARNACRILDVKSEIKTPADNITTDVRVRGVRV
jgi:hypothetical protein